MSRAGRAVVLGGAGFIGSTLVDRLLETGWVVTVVDSFEPFYARGIKERNLTVARRSPAFRLVEADTRDARAIESAIGAARPDVVVDLAARAGVRPSIADPQLYIDINVRGLQNSLSATAGVGAKYVFASSSSVYGGDPRRPFREDLMLCRPESPYGATKIAGEALVHAHHRATGLPIAIARLFTVFGPRQRPDLAIHKFARQILANQPVELYDHGRAERDYTYIDDAVRALIGLVDCGPTDVVVNIGSHRPIKTVAVVDELERLLGRPAQRVLLPPQPGDVPATYADVSRAREIIGWEPTTPFDQGLARFVDWLRGEGPRGPGADVGSPRAMTTRSVAAEEQA